MKQQKLTPAESALSGHGRVGSPIAIPLASKLTESVNFLRETLELVTSVTDGLCGHEPNDSGPLGRETSSSFFEQVERSSIDINMLASKIREQMERIAVVLGGTR
ncbi:hypothetical protein [Aminobacter sp. MDW-2]|uniref:hypothetical protein n=1 Tax=Aminobacter sp. MDW-2 TaxID=2666139 RepID=UPI0012B12B27|nr:hypothetical protein [Aminobacter sp. MDW-2]MRX32822.1 hypothetical protein [Aminobacter sp. MDW-2]QNH34519.1 hypothetical protein H5P29_00765 [Aminobacter sp. MDW-2]